MVVRAQAATLWGVQAQAVTVEVFRGSGLPGVALVGLARGATRESWVRVRAALGHLALALNRLHLVVNLVPADRPKEASTLELALAVAVWVAAGKLPAAALVGRRFWGEVGLDGQLMASPGALLVADLAASAGDRELLLPMADGSDAARVPGARAVAASSLEQVLQHLSGARPLPPVAPPRAPARAQQGRAPGPVRPAASAPALPRGSVCLSQVVGQAEAKRALEVAAAGNHNILLVGPPGSGKTLLAQALPGILPPLPPAAETEVLRIRAAAAAARGQSFAESLQHTAAAAGAVPFRAPHHTSSTAALLGGGQPLRPGEVTLAHRGVLFLDELPEFHRRTLEALREPLEDGQLQVARAQASLLFPARFMLVAAMNPCPCGHFVPPPPAAGARAAATAAGALGAAAPASAARACLCPFERVQRYRARLSGPLLDRIDLRVTVAAVPFAALREAPLVSSPALCPESSWVVRARVARARALQSARLGEGRTNAEMDAAEVQRYAPLCAQGQALLQEALQRGQLSMRGLARVRKVARTLADLAPAPAPAPAAAAVGVSELKEALRYVRGGGLQDLL